ncbi:MAG: hypothetical protein ACJAXJ_003562 [Colwellia sp.]|jgi:hypothetical protein
MVGNATIKAKTQALSQIEMIFVTIPTLKALMTKDIMLDISNDIKKENTTF